MAGEAELEDENESEYDEMNDQLDKALEHDTNSHLLPKDNTLSAATLVIDPKIVGEVEKAGY